jgi:basic amino acid/polyamine antiporter, APA family
LKLIRGRIRQLRNEEMISLARKLHATDYFTLAFGTMVGVGWLVVMDDWLQRGGPLGAILGFVLGGAALLPIGYVYGRLVIEIPDAGSEIAYTEKVFPREISFWTGWVMTLAYWVVCPWEAVAIGKIAAYLFPALNAFELYRVAGKPVYLPHLAIGLALAAAITALNYRGILVSARFQNWTTFGLLTLFALFASFGIARGSVRNFQPLFSHSSFVSTLLVVQIVPYFMTGFESVPKCAEEAYPEFRSRGFFTAILAAVLGGIVFYASVIAVVAFIYPWQPLTRQSFATAFAFRQAFASGWIVKIILAAALLSLLKVFNGNFIASSRVLYALGRRGLIDERIGRVHERNRTPANAALLVGLLTAVGAFAGEAILIPITEVGSMASAVGWLATCAAFLAMVQTRARRAIAAVGALVAAALLAMKFLPAVPGHFSVAEYCALALWILTGLVFRRRANGGKQPTSGS